MPRIEPETITKKFLLALSKRLSSRKDCRHIQYQVIIRDGSIDFKPPVEVFKNRYHRSECDKVPVQDMVLDNFVSSYLSEWIKECMVPGTYMYKLSIDGKRRRWTKLMEDDYEVSQH